eukprot:CAMPEP_0116882228 /NCGR_PEP_ID=MMETSP0463-20121206/14430_1 /TAXON_ID=181622 /ORGANISM="Strombidinopsis sp, Strain SopsisLIS2011" /LENGTH=67 /DNA_ID=CAMNT_0004535143 /DNA_START=254 /DNA_END=457 /DNA_ORIENTATION=+
MGTYLEDFRKNPLSANPYIVITCFDELIRKRDLALIRGDVICNMDRDEGSIILQQLIDSYLINDKYE